MPGGGPVLAGDRTSRLGPMYDALASYFSTSAPAAVQAAYLFGSHARNSAHLESDLDIGVLLDRSMVATRADRAAMAESLTTTLIGVTHQNAVDVVVLNDAPPELAVAVLD